MLSATLSTQSSSKKKSTPFHLQEKTAAAAAKSLQLCPTLCDPTDGGPPGSPVPGILQARTLEWVRKRLETLYTAQISKSRSSLLPFTVLHSWESQFLGKMIRSPGSLRRRKGFRALEEEIGIWSSQGREKDKKNFFFFKPRADDCTTKQVILKKKTKKNKKKQLILLKDMLFFKLCTNDYITTMYPAWGHVSPSWESSD